jgi:lysophospholipase L1-like esterase
MVAAAVALLAGCTHTQAEPTTSASPAAQSKASHWVEAWQAPPSTTVPNGCGGSGREAALPGNRASSQTLRFAVRPGAGGVAVRIRLSNRYGATPLRIRRVTVGIQATGANAAPRTLGAVAFTGASAVEIPAAGETTSDALTMRVDPARNLIVSIALQSGGVLTWHPIATGTAVATGPGTGDHTNEPSAHAYTYALHSYPVLAGIEVRAPENVGAIVALGDSLTDGASGRPNRHWVDILGARLRAAGAPASVVSSGIACNTLTRMITYGGQPAATRFGTDVLQRSGVSHVIIFEGTNDLAIGATAPAIIDALRALAARAHAAGLKVIGATIIPAPAGGSRRHTVNDWIRTTDVFDGVIDFDAVMRSASNPDRLNPSYDTGDHVHPNTAGHVAMGNAIRLALFRANG